MAEDFLNLPSKSGQDTANAALQQIANTLGVTTDALASAVNLANTAGNNANAKILDLETRWNDLTTKQQQDAEVIDARKGKASLRAKIDELESQSNDIATNKAIVESGTNSKGSYVKYGDGTMLAYGTKAYPSYAGASGSIDVPFAVAFFSPEVACTILNETPGYTLTFRRKTTSYVGFSAKKADGSNVDNGTPITLTHNAVGRWK